MGQGESQDVAMCRRCLHWKRIGRDWGNCYEGTGSVKAVRPDDTCGAFTSKTIAVMPIPVSGWVSPSGAKSSYEMPRYDLIPPSALRRLASRMAYGATKHGENNYQRGVGDPVFHRDRINHLLEHVYKYLAGDRQKDHLAAVMANAVMLMWLDEQSLAPTGEQGMSLNP